MFRSLRILCVDAQSLPYREKHKHCIHTRCSEVQPLFKVEVDQRDAQNGSPDSQEDENERYKCQLEIGQSGF